MTNIFFLTQGTDQIILVYHRESLIVEVGGHQTVL